MPLSFGPSVPAADGDAGMGSSTETSFNESEAVAVDGAEGAPESGLALVGVVDEHENDREAARDRASERKGAERRMGPRSTSLLPAVESGNLPRAGAL